jgi:hypothetical protein
MELNPLPRVNALWDFGLHFECRDGLPQNYILKWLDTMLVSSSGTTVSSPMRESSLPLL